MEFAQLRSRILLVVAALISAGVCLLASRALGVPPVNGADISLLNGHGPVLSLIVVAIVFVGCAALASLVVGRSSEETGLFAAAVGLAVFAVRGGSISTTLRYGGGDGIFVTLATELLLLYGIVATALLACWRVTGDSRKLFAVDAEGPPLSHHLMAVGVQAIVMAIVLFLLGHGASTKQAMVTVALGAYLGSIAAHYAFPIQRGYWLAFGPLLVGLAGYLIERASPGLAVVGRVGSPLAIALPIHHASAGVAAGIFGHWMSLKWAREAASEARTSAATPSTT